MYWIRWFTFRIQRRHLQSVWRKRLYIGPALFYTCIVSLLMEMVVTLRDLEFYDTETQVRGNYSLSRYLSKRVTEASLLLGLQCFWWQCEYTPTGCVSYPTDYSENNYQICSVYFPWLKHILKFFTFRKHNLKFPEKLVVVILQEGGNHTCMVLKVPNVWRGRRLTRGMKFILIKNGIW